MENIRIQVLRDDYMVVTADTERFGKGEVMFEGNTFEQCFGYIKREMGVAHILFNALMNNVTYTDREGRCFPSDMEVVHLYN